MQDENPMAPADDTVADEPMTDVPAEEVTEGAETAEEPTEE